VTLQASGVYPGCPAMTRTLPSKFELIVALMDGSTFEPQRVSAREAATKLAEQHGWQFDDALRATLRAKPRDLPPTRAQASAAAEAVRIEAERERARQQAWQIKTGPLIKLYGSFEAALEPCWRERALIAAVAPWRVAMPAPNHRWTESLDGNSSDEVKSVAIIRALKRAYPVPATFGEAKNEHDYWIARRKELALLLQHDPNSLYTENLDIVVVARQNIVSELFLYKLRVDSLQELHQRCSAIISSGSLSDEKMEGLHADIAVLAARELDRSQLDRRRDVVAEIKLEFERDKGQSARAVARAVRCSPTTVCRVRRQVDPN